MSALTPLAQTRVIPRQMAGGIIAVLAVMVIIAAIAVRLFPADHGPVKNLPTAPLPERIAPVGKVQVGAAPAAEAAPAAAAPAATPAAVPAAAPAAAPVTEKPAAKDSRAEAPAAPTTAATASAVSAAPATTTAAAAVSAGAAVAAAPAEAATTAKAEPKPMRINGRLVYQKTCTTCHANGIAGAPRTGDIKAWGPRIGAGTDALLASALNGKGAMPPRGGNAKLSDAEVRAALEYMLNQFASK